MSGRDVYDRTSSPALIRRLVRALKAVGATTPEAEQVIKGARAHMEPTVVDFSTNWVSRKASKSRIQSTLNSGVPIYLGPDGVFFAFVGEASENRGVEADSLELCKHKAAVAWQWDTRVTWTRAIHVAFTGRARGGGG
jgi:hypothetical protein